MILTQHALSSAFPSMPEDEFDALVADIAANGQREAITVFEGTVIDGWHRYRACTQLGIAPITVTFDGDADPVAFVMSRNLRRRHLSASQRAMAVAACAQWMPVGRPGNSAPGALLPGDEPAAKTLDELADDAGVSRRTMAQASKVAKHATQDVAAAVTDGSLSVKRAAEITARPATKQAAEHSPPRAKAPPSPPADSELLSTIEAQAAQICDLAASVRELIADNDSMGKVFDADDKLAEALKQNSQLRAEVSTLRERVAGLMNEKNAAIRQAKSWERKAISAERAAA